MSKLLVKNPAELLLLKEREIQQKELVEQNPLIKDVDKENYDESKKRRTALVKGRTSIEKEQKAICSALSDASKQVKTVATELISITLPHEQAQQSEIDIFEGEIKKAKEAKEIRLRAAKDEMNDINNEFITGINNCINIDSLDAIKVEVTNYNQGDDFPDELKEEFSAGRNRVLLAIVSRRRLLELEEHRANEERSNLILRYKEHFGRESVIPKEIDDLRDRVLQADSESHHIIALTNNLRDDIAVADLDGLSKISTIIKKKDEDLKKWSLFYMWADSSESLIGQVAEREKNLNELAAARQKAAYSRERTEINKQFVELFAKYPDEDLDNDSLRAIIKKETDRIEKKAAADLKKKQEKKDKVLAAKIMPYKDALLAYILSLECSGDPPGRDVVSVNELLHDFTSDVSALRERYIFACNEL